MSGWVSAFLWQTPLLSVTRPQIILDGGWKWVGGCVRVDSSDAYDMQTVPLRCWLGTELDGIHGGAHPRDGLWFVASNTGNYLPRPAPG